MKIPWSVLLFLPLVACSSSSSNQSTVSMTTQQNCVPASELSGIVGGTQLTETDPLTKRVVMLLMDGTDGASVCTGTPISDTVILTAAHCMQGVDTRKALAIFHTSFTCESGFDKTSQSVAVSSFIIHDNYKKAGDSGDLALVKLAGSIPASYKISKIYDGKTHLTDDQMTFLGYGEATEGSNNSVQLRTVQKSRSDVISVDSTKNIIEWSQVDGKGVCHGDSGGPLLVNVGGDLQIVGVNSYVRASSQEKECHDIGAATYAPSYADWIQQSLVNLN